MSEEVTVDEALDALVEDGEKIVTEEDQSLPRLKFAFQNYEDLPRYKALFSGERKKRYEKWKVDEALTDLRSAVGSWAEENGYELRDGLTEVFDEPIDEQLIANLEGEINTEEENIEFGFYGGQKIITLSTNPSTHTDNPGMAITAHYDNFNGNMTEEYRELNAITEAVLSKYGRIVKSEPDCL
ncbi:MAG: hypothetical protein ACI9LV_000274 [Candidatus Nanohaloarchaea archaeon]|jgi:hypothetical protein